MAAAAADAKRAAAAEALLLKQERTEKCADVQKELDSAVDQIDKNLKDNYYYVKAKNKQ